MFFAPTATFNASPAHTAPIKVPRTQKEFKIYNHHTPFPIFDTIRRRKTWRTGNTTPNTSWHTTSRILKIFMTQEGETPRKQANVPPRSTKRSPLAANWKVRREEVRTATFLSSAESGPMNTRFEKSVISFCWVPKIVRQLMLFPRNYSKWINTSPRCTRKTEKGFDGIIVTSVEMVLAICALCKRSCAP